jgi:hypothetical protein
MHISQHGHAPRNDATEPPSGRRHRIDGRGRAPCEARRGPWKTVEDVELATLGWVHRSKSNSERLHQNHQNQGDSGRHISTRFTKSSSSTAYDVYDLIEFLVQHIGRYREAQLTERVNTMLAMNHGGHRVVDQYVVPVTNAAELVSIENAIASTRDRRTRG